jgi:hypothetical protein
MKNEKEKELTGQEQEEINAWFELWKFANSSINEADIGIDFSEFVEDGKKLFDLKIKPQST